jgi:DUF971 family protein
MRPTQITIDRGAGVMQVAWQDGHQSDFSLTWLRGNCPCATCREERRAAVENTNPLRLVSTPPPSTAVAAAEFVGHYAIRLTWDDGHATGIYPFTGLRACCPCSTCNPDGPPPLVYD